MSKYDLGYKFSLRKLKVGTASVAIAGVFLLTTGIVKADDTANVADSTASQVIVDANSQADTYTESDLSEVQDSQEQAIAQAEAAGVEVTTKDIITTSDLSQAVENTEADTVAIEDATAQQEQNNAEYTQALETYNQEVANNQIIYEQEVADYEFKTTSDGYLSQAVGQNLTFETGSEQNTVAEVDVNATPVDTTEALEWVDTNATEDKEFVENIVTNPDYIDDGSLYYFYLDTPTTVTYNNLENAYFGQTKIASVVYTYTLEEGQSDRILAKVFDDPTVTIDLITLNQDTQMNLVVDFLDDAGSNIDVSSALLSFNSLNSDTDSTEYVSGFNGQYITINGSSITYDSELGRAYSATSNASLEEGSRYNQDDWDGTSLSWYGAIVGRVTDGGRISFSFGSENRSTQWFAFNSTVKAYQVPTLKVIERPNLTTISVSYTPYNYIAAQTGVTLPNTENTSNYGQIDNKVSIPYPSGTVQNSADTATSPLTTVASEQTFNQENEATLPSTGDQTSSIIGIIIGILLIFLGLFDIRKNKTWY